MLDSRVSPRIGYRSAVTTESMQREFRFHGVFNFRDLGGYPAADGRRVRWRRLFRSDSLSRLTEDDRAGFQRLGVRTVVDLRRGHELAAQGRVPAWDGLVHRHVPPPHTEWSERPYQYGGDVRTYLVSRYLELAEEGASGLADALRVLADADATPAVVHCVAGKDRTGVVCALALALLGVPDQDIDHDYTRSTANNQHWIEWAQRNGDPTVVMRPWFYSVPGTMTTFLAQLRARYGSIAQYVTDAGLTCDDVTALRTHLLH